MNVAIIETKSGRVVGKYPVSLRGLNYEPTEREYFELALKCAVDDGMVDSDRREDYAFQLQDSA